MENKINKIAVKDEFCKKIDRLTKSKAYLDYCEEVYGYRDYFFNMMDKQQIDFLLTSIPIFSDDTVIDLGCGTGSILNLLIKRYGCNGIGIDQLNNSIIEKTGKTFMYINDDFDKVFDYNLRPTIILSIDSLYFSDNTERLIQQLYNFKNSTMYLYYSQYIFDEISKDRSVLDCHKTKIAEILNKNHIPFQTIDYSENECLLYKNSLNVLKKYKQAFEDEGNKDLYDQKLKEDTLGMELYNKNLASRYLYIINGTKK